MAIEARCPSCGSRYNLRDELEGKSVRCKKCEKTFVVKAGKDEEDAPAVLPAKKPSAAIQTEDRPVKPVAAKRQPAADDDEPRPRRRPAVPVKKKSNAWVWIVGLCVGIPLLCCGGGIGGLYWFVWRPAKRFANDVNAELQKAMDEAAAQQGAAGGPVVFFGRNPQNVDEALVWLTDPEAGKRGAAANWLGRQELDPNRQAEVSKALDPLLTDANGGVQTAVLEGLKVWATKDNVPGVIIFLQDETFSLDANKRRELALEIAGKLKDPRFVPHTAKYLANGHFADKAKNALQQIGPDAAPETAKYLFSKDGGARERAQALLRQWNTPDAVALTAAAEALGDRDKDRRRLTCEWLEKAQVDAARRPEVAKALDPLLADPDHGVQGAAVKALTVWATTDNVPALIQVVEDEKRAERKLAMQILGKLKDPRAAAPLAARLPNFFDRRDASLALEALGPAAAEEVKKYLNHKDNGVRHEVARLLKAYGSKDNIELTQKRNDLKSPEKGRRHDAVKWFIQAKPDDAQRAEVAAALEELLGDPDVFLREDTIRALAVWGGKDNSPALIKLVEDQSGGARRLAMEALAKFKDPRAVAPIAKHLTIGGDRRWAADALIALGPASEDEVAKHYLDVRYDKAVRLEACRILQQVGTKASAKILATAVQLYSARKEKDAVIAAQMALAAVQTR